MPLQKQASFSDILYGHAQTGRLSRKSCIVAPTARLAPTRKSLFAHHRHVYRRAPRDSPVRGHRCARRACRKSRALVAPSLALTNSHNSRQPFARLSTEAQATHLAL